MDQAVGKEVDSLEEETLPGKVIERSGKRFEEYKGCGLHMYLVNGVSYVAEGATYDAATNTWIYESLKESGAWEWRIVPKETIKKRVPEFCFKLEVRLGYEELEKSRRVA